MASIKKAQKQQRAALAAIKKATKKPAKKPVVRRK